MKLLPGLKLLLGRSGAPARPEPGASLDGGSRDAVDLVTPPGFYVGRNEVQLGGRQVRVHFVDSPPSRVWVGWLSEAQGFGDVDVSVHLEPVPNREAVRELTRRIANAGALVDMAEKAGSLSAEAQAASGRLGDAVALRDRVMSDEARVFNAVVALGVAAADAKTLDYQCSVLTEVMGGRSVRLLPAFLRQAEGLRTVLPVGDCALYDKRRVFDTGAASTVFPFVSADLAHPNGVMLGANWHTGAPVFYDSFAVPPLTNHNVGVFAVAGAGKSFLVKLMSARYALQGARTVVLDPEGEYRPLVGALGGVHIKFSPREVLINPFELDPEETEQGPVLDLSEKARELKGLITAVLETYGEGRRLAPEEAAILERAVREEYEARGISEDPATLYERAPAEGYGLRKKEMPTFSSLHARLKSVAGAERLLALLEVCLRGRSAGMFDGPSKVELGTSPLLCFDFSELEEGYARPVAMQFALEWVWERFVKRDLLPKRVVVDEAWLFMKHPKAASFLENMSRRSRKRVCSFVVSTQNWREFASADEGRAVLTNMGTVVLMRQNPVDLDFARETFRLSEGEVEFLRVCDRGECLLKAGPDTVALRVLAHPAEAELLQTGIRGGGGP